MSEIQPPSGSARLTRQIKLIYWTALALIAAMATTSYLQLDGKLSEHREDRALLAIVGTQATLSQRIVFLANQTELARLEARPALVVALSAAVSEFQHNHDRLLVLSGVEATGPANRNADMFSSILFGQPHHLDHFTSELVSRTHRYIAATEREAGMDVPSSGYSARSELKFLDANVANETLRAYAELNERMVAAINARLVDTLASHRMLYFMTLAMVLLVGLFIFRPMANAIGRKTRELMEARNSMAFIAAHDGLTGLYNRAFLVDRFDAIIRDAARRNAPVAVLQIDLDEFKQINDTFGHAAGDLVLATTARRLRETSGASDLCVRLGGDEFVMILTDPDSVADVGMIARRLLGRIAAPMNFEGTKLLCDASIGVAVYPTDADNARDLLVHADLALYNAKRAGGGAFSLFSDELRRELDHRKRMENDLRQAVADRAFTVHYQPQVSMERGCVTGVEALVRWSHPQLGMIAPGQFLSVAEQAGLMADIGRLVIAQAIRDAATWHFRGMEFGRLAVNVSGAELREADFSKFLFDTLADAGLPTTRLALEIVESVILDDEKTGIAGKLRLIRAAGVHLELDDFGTGYASLSHVNPNEIDRLKIDRRFVHAIDANGDNSAIVRAITELAGGLGIDIVAEGAETERELSFLSRIGCDQVQGYAIARPMPEADLRNWLVGRKRKQPALHLAAAAVA